MPRSTPAKAARNRKRAAARQRAAARDGGGGDGDAPEASPPPRRPSAEAPVEAPGGAYTRSAARAAARRRAAADAVRAAVRERVILGLLAWARSVTDAPLQRSESAPVRAPPLRPVGRGAGRGAGGPTPPSVPGGLQRAYTAPPALSTRARVARGDAPPPGEGLGQQTGVASASTSTTGRCSPERRFVYVPLREVGAPPASPTASATSSGGESGGAGGAWEAAPGRVLTRLQQP